MTTDDLIDLGHKAGTLFVTQFGVASVTVEWMENFAGLVADAEREACAKVCEEIEDQAYGLWRERAEQLHLGREAGAEQCAAAIRARGNT